MALFGGGTTGVVQASIQYVNIATTGNSYLFGDLTIARQSLASCSSSTRGVFGGGLGAARTNVIDYVTIASIGNATDFGDLTLAPYEPAACSSSTTGISN